MKYVRLLKEIDKHHVLEAGGKGASLGELISAGIPVPAGFVITSEAFEVFMEETGLRTEIEAALDSVDTKEMHTIENSSERIHALIEKEDLPDAQKKEISEAFKKLGAKYVAVRSSATAEDSDIAAWAGQLETYLNTTEKTLIEHVKKCWASLFSPRAIFYRFEKGFHKQKVSVAVVVQAMVESEKSGIAFSVHPVTQDHNQIIIEAGFGLGEAIVSGSITPDSYVVRKDDWRITEKQIHTQERGLYRAKNGGSEWKTLPKVKGSQPTLSDSETIALAKLVTKIERHYRFPVDVEWAQEGNKIFITQSRPITTLSASSADQSNDFRFMWGQKQSAMISEAMMWQLMNTLTVSGKFVPSHIPETLFIMKDGVFEHFMPVNSYKHIAQYGERYMKKTFPPLLERMINRHVKNFFSFADDVHQKNLKRLSNNELLAIIKKYEDYFNKTFVFFGTSSNWWTDKLTDTIRDVLAKKLKNPAKTDEYFIDLCTPSEMDETMKERLEFFDLVEAGRVATNDLEKYARRFPALFFNTYSREEVRAFLKSRAKEERSKNFKEERKRILGGLSAIRKRQDKIYKELSSPLLRYCSKTLQKSAVDRYRLKHVWSGGEYLFLDFFKELQTRIGISFDDFIKTYTFSDIKRFLHDGKALDAHEVKLREQCFVMHSKDGTVHQFRGDKALQYISALLPISHVKNDSDSTIKGQIANKGLVRGKARVAFVKDLKQFLHDSKQFKKGEILVTTMTSPVMIPLIEKASGIITDEGGICSHAAVSAREFGIPCIIGTHGASSIIKTGDELVLDANQGSISIVSSKKAFDSSKEWVPYLTRPFNLFGASLWQAWYDSNLIKKLLGTYFPSALFIEEHLNVVRLYREASDLSAFKSAIKNIVTKRAAYLQSIFEHGFELNDEALAYISGKKKCADLDEAVRFMVELALHATVIPNFALPLITETKKETKLKKLGEELRGKSHYPKFISDVLMPLAKKKLRQLGVADVKRSIDLITLQELLAGNVQELPRRIEARYKQEQRFVYQKMDKVETVSWVSDPLPLIADLENIDLEKSKGLRQLKGQVAFRGKVKGIARVILRDNTKGVRFDKGDILVSIHSSPTLMPLLLRCAAIVTDEGGISCHAAIVSRELKKPCVMSTKIATSIIKDGDFIEVDAEHGIVRILKQKSKV